MDRFVRAFPFALCFSSAVVASQPSGETAIAQNDSEAAVLTDIDSLATEQKSFSLPAAIGSFFNEPTVSPAGSYEHRRRLRLASASRPSRK
jgi:hypothetical protein